MAEDWSVVEKNRKVHLITEEGPIFGYDEDTEVGKFQYFYGIPYAKPPTGQLRFLPPVPMPPWRQEIDCTKPVEFIDNETCVCASEDCLYINVKTKNVSPAKPLPVMFWVGGYKYTYSLDSSLDPRVLIEEDIIFVNCGYRQGPFGFLSINEPVAPGNAGLKDIALALKWVQRNIAIFGGDPNNVTLFGSSSGAPTVHLMMMSSMTSGLFHKAILQSACALNNWLLMKNPTQPVLELAKELGITASCNTDIVEKLKTIPEKDIVKAFMVLEGKVIQQDHDADMFNPLFKPCIEAEFEGQVAFLTKNPTVILKSGKFHKVPLIIGSNNIEASILQYLKDDFYKNYHILNDNMELIVPKSLARDMNTCKKIGKQILEFYIGKEENLREDTKEQYLQMISDYYYIYYVNKSVRLHSQFASEACPVFYYILNYAGDWKIPKKIGFFNTMGQCGDLPYVFGIRTPGEGGGAAAGGVAGAGRDCLQVRRRVVRMWTNFAKYGNPTPDEDDPLLQITWEPVKRPEHLDYLLIGADLTKGRNPFRERMMFWDRLHDEHIFLRALIVFNDMGVKW